LFGSFAGEQMTSEIILMLSIVCGQSGSAYLVHVAQAPPASAPSSDLPAATADELRGLFHGEPRVTGSLGAVRDAARIHVTGTHLTTAGELPADSMLKAARSQLHALLPKADMAAPITEADLVVEIVGRTEFDSSGVRFEGGVLVYCRAQLRGCAGEQPIYTVLERGDSLEDVVDHAVSVFAHDLEGR
jgi:hypothetical protein